MDQETFGKEIEKVMHYGLNINAIDSMSSNQLRNLIIEPEEHIKERLVTSKNIIDQRSQMRKLNTLKESKEYKELIATISKLKKDSQWVSKIEFLEIGRGVNGLKIRLY